MSSFTSNFKPWLLAAAALILIETIIFFGMRPNTIDRGSILEFGYAREETPQRLFVYHKLKAFEGVNATFVMSGDSSGFYGINPLEVESVLPEGHRLYNLSCCANLGFNGYYNVLRYMLEQSQGGIDYIILHITPYTMPRPETWFGDGAALWSVPELTTFGETVGKALAAPSRYLNLPSLGFRREVTWATHNLFGLVLPYDRPMAAFATYPSFLEMFERTRGWMPENDIRVHVPPTPCEIVPYRVLDWQRLSYRPLINVVFDAYAALARQHGARLVVVFQPVACTEGEANRETIAHLEEFKRENPDVLVPFPLITTWPSERFSVPAHVKDEWRHATSARLGQALAFILAQREQRPASSRQ